MEMKITGMLVTFAMNQHWARYSFHQSRMRGVAMTPSSATANMFPDSRMTKAGLATRGFEAIAMLRV